MLKQSWYCSRTQWVVPWGSSQEAATFRHQVWRPSCPTCWGGGTPRPYICPSQQVGSPHSQTEQKRHQRPNKQVRRPIALWWPETHRLHFCVSLLLKWILLMKAAFRVKVKSLQKRTRPLLPIFMLLAAELHPLHKEREQTFLQDYLWPPWLHPAADLMLLRTTATLSPTQTSWSLSEPSESRSHLPLPVTVQLCRTDVSGTPCRCRC